MCHQTHSGTELTELMELVERVMTDASAGIDPRKLDETGNLLPIEEQE